MVKYCDRCKWDTETCSKGIPDEQKEETIETCPDCGQPLYEAPSWSDIP